VTSDPTASVTALYDRDPQPDFDEPAAGRVFDPPMVAVAAADDPWFARFKDVIGPFHWTPQEALARVAPGATARSVLCWCLPVSEYARRANRDASEIASRPWAYVRTFGEQLNDRLRRGLEQVLRDAGAAAIAPHTHPDHRPGRREDAGWSSCWSERHAAFVAGLGTFGISGGLITSRGVAHRLGSVVTDVELAPTPRPYGDDPFAWCLRAAKGTCGACIKRCPAGSVGEDTVGRDKDACFRWTYQRVRGDKGVEIYGWLGAYGCGLCQTAVPCEDRNPLAET